MELSREGQTVGARAMECLLTPASKDASEQSCLESTLVIDSIALHQDGIQDLRQCFMMWWPAEMSQLLFPAVFPTKLLSWHLVAPKLS